MHLCLTVECINLKFAFFAALSVCFSTPSTQSLNWVSPPPPTQRSPDCSDPYCKNVPMATGAAVSREGAVSH